MERLCQARVALTENTQDVYLFLHRIEKRNFTDSKLAKELFELLRERPTQLTPLRRATEKSVPVDPDSRFQLFRVEMEPKLPNQPVYAEVAQQTLDGLATVLLQQLYD